ncbi:YheV family putative zinc ribbon protein [Marinobacterium arenosum]|uniref:YheV family putative zinc ribbon protein n=1 Tax=Marinobacterium arenosum TaxID=2862496 RepID=UPI001C948C02|nr:YheV family putative zinc ribbon protein [Marinobacterium arenosum]MBY4676508.1 YheV family putative metal-binding protein [Marinobacterium arenosum]
MSNPVKRFIAGAVCPRCGEMDKLRMYRDETREYRECVSCDFSDSMALDGSDMPSQELETRVNRVPEPVDPEAKPLLFKPNPVKK